MLKARKWLNFPIHPCLRPPLGRNLLECRDEIWHQKARIVGLPDGVEIMTFWHNTGVWQTDGRTRCSRKDPRWHSVAREKYDATEYQPTDSLDHSRHGTRYQTRRKWSLSDRWTGCERNKYSEDCLRSCPGGEEMWSQMLFPKSVVCHNLPTSTSVHWVTVAAPGVCSCWRHKWGTP